MPKWILWEGDRKVHTSGDFYKLRNYITRERLRNAVITYNGCIVWVQNPDKYWAEREI